MLKKLKVKKTNRQREFEERTANARCDIICWWECYYEREMEMAYFAYIIY